MSQTSLNLPLSVVKNRNLPESEEADLARKTISVNEQYNAFLRAGDISSYPNTLKELATRIDAIIAAGFMRASTLNLAGRIYADLFDYERANQHYRKALALSKTNNQAQTLCNMGYLGVAMGKYSEAKSRFNEALAIESNSVAAFKGLAHAFVMGGEYDLAIVHYQSLLSLGITDTIIQEHLAQCLENLRCETFTEDLESLVLYVSSIQSIDPARLTRFAGELLAHKYNLTRDLHTLDLDILVQDPLFLMTLESGVSANEHIELLVTEVRRCITLEATQSLKLRDELLGSATAIAHYAAQSDYALYIDEDEEAQVSALKQILDVSLTGKPDDLDDATGAIILLGMYEALYVQRFAYRLLARELNDWPQGTQTFLRSALYDLSDEHKTHFELFGHSVNELLDNSVNRAFEKWEPYSSPLKQNIYQALQRQWSSTKLPVRFRHAGVRILLVECGAGKRAFELASKFSNVNVVAVDACKRNLSYAFNKTRPLAMDNLELMHCESYDEVPSDAGVFDIIEFGSNFEYANAGAWLKLLEKDGLVRFQLPSTKQQDQIGMMSDLIKARHLQGSLDNIRMLRHSIMLENQTELWQDLLATPSFFSSSGCRDLWFSNRKFYDDEQARELIDGMGVQVITDDAKTSGLANMMRTMCTDHNVLDFYAQPAA